jgi:ABC-2 type transport system permease protein
VSIRHLLVHEMRVLARGRSAVVVLPLLVIVVTYAANNGVRWTREQQVTIARVQAEDECTYAAIADQLEDLERRGDPRPDLPLAGMAWYIVQPAGAVVPAPHIDPRRAEAAASEWLGARHAVLPPAPLAALAVGQSDLHPYYSRVTIRTRPALVNSDEIENPVNLLNGRFDLAFVLTFCWPPLVLPLIYNVLSDDREHGTLALVASQVVSVRAVIAMRLLTRVGLAVVVTIVASVGALRVLGAVGQPGTAAAVAVWCSAVLATGLLWSGVAALVNTAGWRSATNATVITAIWLCGAIVIPAVLGEVAAVVEPVPSRVQLINEIRAAGNMRPAELAQLLTAYYEEHPDATPSRESADVTAIRGLALQDETDRRIDPIVSAHRHAAARQQRVANRLRFASPVLLIYDSVTELAGTTTGRYRRFAEQLDTYHRSWRAYFYPLVHARVSLTRAHYDRAPRFTFLEEPAGSAERRATILTGVAGSIGLVLLAVAFRRMSSSAVTPT